jgi:hypothetical protein
MPGVQIACAVSYAHATGMRGARELAPKLAIRYRSPILSNPHCVWNKSSTVHDSPDAFVEQLPSIQGTGERDSPSSELYTATGIYISTIELLGSVDQFTERWQVFEC